MTADINVSGIHPVGGRILILPMEVEEKTQGGIIISHGQMKDREDMANTTGVVVELGENAYCDYNKPWCKVGDRVIFAKYSGLLYLGKDDKKYRVINDTDVTGTLDSDVKLVDPHLRMRNV
jgi:co-chaperonin GroES (HSP10)